MKTPEKVAARYAGALGLGKTWENGKVRIHRFRDVFHVWDLVNAGKRGKKVRVLAVDPPYGANPDKWMEEQSKRLVLMAGGGYDSIKKYLDSIDAKPEESLERGVDVRPGDAKEYKLSWGVGDKKLRLTASPTEFLLNSSVPLKHPKTGDDIGNQDTLYYQVGRRDAAVFYRWLASGGDAKIQRMGISEIRELWRKLKVKSDYY